MQYNELYKTQIRIEQSQRTEGERPKKNKVMHINSKTHIFSHIMKRVNMCYVYTIKAQNGSYNIYTMNL